VEKYCRVKHATDDNMPYAHCTLDTQGYKHTVSEYVILHSSTATVVTWRHLSVTLYVRCLSCRINCELALQTVLFCFLVM